MTVRVAAEINPRDLRRLERALERIDPSQNASEILGKPFLRFGFRVQRRATQDYMRGPRPLRIDVVTGTLRRSIAVDRGGLPWRISIGSDLIYAPVHELGSPKLGIPARPYLAPAVRDESGELADDILRSWERQAIT